MLTGWDSAAPSAEWVRRRPA